MAKLLNCCGEADHFLFYSHYSLLTTQITTQITASD